MIHPTRTIGKAATSDNVTDRKHDHWAQCHRMFSWTWVLSVEFYWYLGSFYSSCSVRNVLFHPYSTHIHFVSFDLLKQSFSCVSSVILRIRWASMMLVCLSTVIVMETFCKRTWTWTFIQYSRFFLRGHGEFRIWTAAIRNRFYPSKIKGAFEPSQRNEDRSKTCQKKLFAILLRP